MKQFVGRSAAKLIYDLPEFHDLKWALRPVVLPAYDEIAAGRIVPMFFEGSRAKFEFDPNTLPSLVSPINAPLGLAVGKPRVHGLNYEADLVADHAEKEDNALLVNWGVP